MEKIVTKHALEVTVEKIKTYIDSKIGGKVGNPVVDGGSTANKILE